MAIDAGIVRAVKILRDAGIETFESCDGTQGHALPEPTIRFHGGRTEGWKALSAALDGGLPVLAIRRAWPIVEGEPTGPWWEIVFHPTRDRGC
jgi:hypothetical protein